MSERTFATFVTDVVDAEGGEKRALAFEVARDGARRRIGHGGFHWGVRTQLDIYPDDRTVVVILSNSDTTGMEAIRGKARRWIAGLPSK